MCRRAIGVRVGLSSCFVECAGFVVLTVRRSLCLNVQPEHVTCVWWCLIFHGPDLLFVERGGYKEGGVEG